jgi:hypothetical protein
VFLERVVAHYRRAGWQIEPLSSVGWGKAAPDFLARKGNRTMAVLVRAEEPPGPFLVGEFGAQCRRRQVSGAIVAPDDPALVELCETAGVDLVPGESIGEVAIMGASPEPALAPTPAPSPLAVRLPQPALIEVPQRTVWWRWALVAAIWLLALWVLWLDYRRSTR